jgi:uncharacterized BrkB/YihY/UPF0761 family membrane protein
VGNFGAGLAFNAFLTMFPLVLGILSMIGLVIHDPGMQEKFQSSLVGVFPADAHAELLSALGGVKRNAGLLGIVSACPVSDSAGTGIGRMVRRVIVRQKPGEGTLELNVKTC